MKRYCVWGVDKTYRYLWVACVVAGIRAAKQRWNLSGHENVGNDSYETDHAQTEDDL